MERETIKNKEDFAFYILEQLRQKVHPIPFGAFFMEVSPSGGIDSFRNLLDELHGAGLLIKLENPGDTVPYLPHPRTFDLRYSHECSRSYKQLSTSIGMKCQLR